MREDNRDINKSIVYTYDGYGNILNKKEYAFTTGSLGAVTDTISYTYDSTWKDKLTSYDGQSISYDAIGNPTSYRGATITWNGRKLMSYTKGDDAITYEYDGDGLRTTKTVNGATYNYYYEDGLLIHEVKEGEYELFYRYDGEGQLFSITRYRYSDGESTNLYAVNNTRGDVLELRKADGTLYCRYVYDSWGRLVSAKNASGNNLSASTIGYQNSVRYRGYVYDHETGLYYLQSRYYDPETGRFLNADSVDYIGYSGEQLSYNAFAYCENNPIHFSDPFGCAISYKVLQGVLGGILGGITQYISDLINVRLFYEEWSKATKYVSAVVKGAWDAVTNSGFFKKLLVAIGSNIIGQIIYKIRYKVDFSYQKIFKTVIDFTFDYVVGEILNIKAPNTIKDIKSKARELGIKGTKKLTAYLNSAIFETNLANITLSNLRSWIKLLSQGAFKKLFGSKAKYVT